MTHRHTIAATVGAALALADVSVVVLAQPPILAEFDASVEAVAAVIGAYTLALAAAPDRHPAPARAPRRAPRGAGHARLRARRRCVWPDRRDRAADRPTGRAGRLR